MSNDVVISVENLWKQYRYGTISHRTLRKDLQSWWARTWDKEDPNLRLDQIPLTKNHELRTKNEEGEADRFWALKDVSFEVRQGEVLGIIGRNGAGKSTLLKIISRVTTPTRGEIKLKGRIASLLEVGTGFHPELTGRENIFLNGAILGMTKAEIRQKFYEIVAFAEIEKFIDTPVKRYSSGMYVRLAFAVAAHLEPEILLVDEVLAVGDAQFQKKCVGKMEEVGKEGRTVLFVSHSMDNILRLCGSAILLKDGSVQITGNSERVINVYLKEEIGSNAKRQWNVTNAPGNEVVRLVGVYAHKRDGNISENFDVSEPVGITMEYEVLKPGYLLTPAFNFYNERGVNIFDSHNTSQECRTVQKPVGHYSSTVWIPENFLSEGIIVVGAAIITPDPFSVHFHEEETIAFNMVDSFQEVSARGDYVGSMPGMIRPLLQWESVRNDDLPKTANDE